MNAFKDVEKNKTKHIKWKEGQQQRLERESLEAKKVRDD